MRQECRHFGVAIATLVISLLSGFISSAQAVPFTAGNLVIYRVGSGTGSLADTGNPVFLDEYSPAGTLVQSIPMPSQASGVNRSLVASGTAMAEGGLTRSADGRFLVATGYDASIPYATPLPGTAANTVYRTIGRVDHNGIVDTSTYLQDFADGGEPRSAATADGSSFWMVGTGAGGVRYAPYGTTTNSTLIAGGLSIPRQTAIFGGQLYVSAAPLFRIASVGSGLPTTSAETVTPLPGLPGGSPYGFFLADLSPTVAGVDTLYVADDSIGLRKFSLVGGTWLDSGTIGTNAEDYRGISATVSGNTVTLFATRLGGTTATGGGELVTFNDTSGHNGPFSGTPTLLATAAANTAFRGVAPAPVLVLESPPSITTQPASQTITSGSTATLSVTATGTEPLAYQWYQGNSGDTSTPVGTNSASFTTPALTSNTSFWVRVTNDNGSADSDTTIVRINLLTNGGFESPAIGGNLLSVYSPNSTTLTGWTVSAGDVEIIRTGIWSPSEGLQSLDMSGISAATIYQDVSGLIPGATYRITFDLSGNPAKPSALIKQLRVTAAGQSNDFDFDVTSTDSTTMGWVGRDVTLLATAAAERIQFQSITPGDRGPALDNVALVMVAPPTDTAPAITTQPASQTIASGSIAMLTVTATGTEPLAYQWYQGNSGDTSTPVGTNSSSFTTPALTNSTSYWVKVSNGANPTGVNSSTANLTVGQQPLVTTGPATAVTETTATLNGTVNPNGLTTITRFEYGLTTAYGSIVDVILDPADGTTVQNVSAAITGLERGQTYHYRLVATSSVGTVFDNNVIFTAAASGTQNTAWVGLGNQTFPEAIWGGVANWSTGAPPSGANNIAMFGNSFGCGYACTLNYATTIGRMVYNDPANANDFIFRNNASDFILTLDVTSGLPSFNVAQAGRTLIIQPRIGGNDGFAKNGPGRLVLANGNSTYTGPIQINAGLLEIGGGVFTFNNGKPAPNYVEQTFNLGDAGRVGNGNYAGSILIAGGAGFLYNSSADTTLIGAISGDGSLGKANTGTLTLTNANLYKGATTVSGGTLRLGSPSSLPEATDLMMEGGILDLNGQNATVKSLAVGGATAIIDFGNAMGANALQITNGALPGWVGSLVIRHFDPATDNLFFGSSAGGINGNESQVIFVDPIGLPAGSYAHIPGDDGAALLSATPIPEPIIITQPASQTIPNGTAAALSVVATGDPAPSFQWYQGISGDETNLISGAISPNFTTPSLAVTTSYWVKVSNSAGSVDSGSVTVTVTAPSAITYQWSGSANSDWAVDGNWTGTAPLDAAVVGPFRLNVNGSTRLIYSAAQGASVFPGDGAGRGLVIGSGSLGSGTMEITGGTFSTLGAASKDVISNNNDNTGHLIVNGGSYIGTNAGIDLGLGTGSGRVAILDVLDGTATIAALNINTDTATINLDGGLLEANTISRTGGTGILNLNGGTLKARQNNSTLVSGLSVVNVRSGGAIIDSNGFNVSITNALLDAGGGGGLTKLGTGTLTLAGLNRYTGNTTITAGTLWLGQANIFNDSSTVAIASGTSLELAFVGTDAVDQLRFAGIPQPAGVYGSGNSGGRITGTGTLTVARGPVPGDDFSLWLWATFGNGVIPANQQGADDDPDADGLSNREEYAFGLDPTVNSSTSVIISRLDPLAGTFTYTRRDPALTGMSYPVWTSPDLVSWEADTGAVQTVIATDGVIQTVLVTLSPSGPIKGYTVRIDGAATNSSKAMLSFGPGAIIDGTTITWTLPADTDLTSLAPIYTISPLASEDPAHPSGSTRDFTTPVVYTITAADLSTKSYTVTVKKNSLGVVPVGNPSFEVPALASGSWGYNPAGTSWVFNQAGIANNASPWFVPLAPDGSQGGFIQYTGGSISQSIAFAEAGNYTVSFSVVGRAGYGSMPLNVLIDGATVLSLTAEQISTGTWQSKMSTPFTVTAGAHTLAFVNGELAGDHANVIDNIMVARPNVAAILSFDFGTLGRATLTGTDINLTVAAGTDVTSLAPSFTLTPGAMCDHVSGTAYDFTNPVVYTVTGADLTTNAYTVTVTRSAAGLAQFTWTGATTGNWSDAARWTNDQSTGTAPVTVGQADYTLNFNVPGIYTATNDLNTGFKVNRLNFGGSAVTLAGNSLVFAANEAVLPRISQTGFSGVTINNPLSLSSDLTVGGAGIGPVTFRGTISGTGGVVKTGPGRVTLDAWNTFTGGMRIDQGDVILENGGWYAGLTGGSGPITVRPGGTLVNWNTHSYGNGTAPNNLLVLEQGRFLLNRETYFGDLTMTAGIVEEYPGATPGITSDLRTRWDVVGSIITILPASVPSEIRCRWSLSPSNVAAVADVADGPAETDLLVSGVVSQMAGGAGLTKRGAGTLRYTGVNTYTGTTTVDGGTLALADNAGLKFAVSDTASNRLAGTGTVRVDGDFTIDTSAVTVTSGTWSLVEVATLTETFGPTFTVSGFTHHADGSAWTRSVGAQNWTFSEATGMLDLTSERILAFNFGTLGTATINGTNITITVPAGTNLTNLAPTFTLLPGTTCDKISGGSYDFTNPVIYTVTAEDLTIRTYTVKVTPGGGLTVKTYDTAASPSNLSPIENLRALTPSGTSLQTANLVVPSGAASTTYPGLVDSDSYSLLWEGWLDVTKDGPGNYSFGTDSDDGSVIFLDLNDDGDFADPGEMIVDNDFFHGSGRVALTGTVALGMDAVRIAIGFYDANGADYMAARFKKGSGLAYTSQDPINGTSGHFFSARPPADPAAANVWNFGLAGYPATISGNQIVWNLPPGTNLTSLAPTFAISSGVGAVPPSGTVRNFTTPKTYAVTAKNGTVKTYTVTARVSVSDGLTMKTFDTAYGANFLNPISNLVAVTPSGTIKQYGNVEVTRGNLVNVLPGLTGNDRFAVLWEGWFDVSKDGPGTYTFGTESDDGAVIYLDLNDDGDFADPGELIVNNNSDHGPRIRTGNVTVSRDSLRIAIGYYENDLIQTMTAQFRKGGGVGFWDLNPINGSTGHFFSSPPPANPSAANLWNFGLPGNPAVMTGTSIVLRVPHTADVTNLAPTFAISASATCDKVSGSARNFSTPQTYTVTSADTFVTSVYTVTVIVDPTWVNDGNGLWSAGVNWGGGIVADGSGIGADFNSVNLTGDRTLILDSPRTIGHLIFGDAAPSSAAGWILSNNGVPANILTLAGGGTITVNALGAGKDATISAQLAGTEGLIKAGAGTLTLTNTNAYGGSTLIEAGVLRLGGTIGGIGSGNVLNYATLAFNRTAAITFTNNISGSGVLRQEGPGTVSLTGANSYQGGTTIHQGTLVAGNAGALGTGTVTNNGTLDLTVGPATYTGLSTGLSGSGTVNVTLGTGTESTLLDGNYFGFVGTWNIGIGAAAGAGKVRMNGADNAAATLNVLANATVYTSGAVTHNASINLNGGDTGESLGQLRLDANAVWAGRVTLAGSITGGGDGMVGCYSGTGTISGNIGETGGSRGLSKAGGGTIVLSGTNNYTGQTSVIGGSLQINNSASLPTASQISLPKNLLNSGTLQINTPGTNTFNNTFAGFNSSYGFANAGLPNIRNMQGKNTFTGSMAVTGLGGYGVNIQSDAGLLTLSGTLQNSVNTTVVRGFDLGGVGNGVIAGLVRDGYANGFGPTAIAKDGSGTWFVTNVANSFTGPPAINAGTLNVARLADIGAPSSLGTGPAAIRLAGGTLQFTGTGAQSTNRNHDLLPAGGTLDASGLTPADTVTFSGTFTAADAAGFSLNFTNGSKVANNTTNAGSYSPGLVVGMAITATGLPAGTVITAINGSQYTLNNNFTGTTGSVPCTFGIFNRTLTLAGSNIGNNVISGVLGNSSGGGKLSVAKAGAGTWVLSGANTYTGTTTVNGGTLALADTGGLKFVVTNSSANRITGTGTVTLNGSFTIDTSSVTINSGSWILVDVASLSESFGASFNLAGFIPAAGGVTWAKNVGTKTWTFSETTGILTLGSSSLKEILAFDFGPLGPATIAGTNITLSVPHGTDVTGLAPSYTVSALAVGNPPSGTNLDFTTPQTYTVTAQDLSTRDYTVTVTPAAASSLADILNFSLPGNPAVITGTNVVLTVPFGTNVAALAPTFTVSNGASAYPLSGTPSDFTTPKTYAVTSGDLSVTKEYVVSVTVAPSPSPPVITLQPLASQAISSGSAATLTVLATGSPSPTFQWYRGSRGDTAVPVAGAISPTLTTAPLTSTSDYWVRATNSQGTADSIMAIVSVIAPPPVPFTPGNLVVYRVGDGITSLTLAGNPVFLDEYTPAGTLVQSVPMPTTITGDNRRLVGSGPSTTEGELMLSPDGRFLVATGYDASIPYSADLPGTPAGTVYRTIARVDRNATVDTSTCLKDFANAGEPRSATTLNGNSFWMAGSSGGVRHAPYGTTTLSTSVSSAIANVRQVGIFGNQLYVSTASGTSVRIGKVGNGLPTATGQTITNLPGYPTGGGPHGYHLADLNASVPGLDTLYAADDLTGLRKYSLVGNAWVSNGTIGTDADDYRGVTATVSGAVVTVYATRNAGGSANVYGGGEIVSIVDANGYNGAFTGTPTLLASAPNTSSIAFRGIALTPTVASDTLPLFTVQPLSQTGEGGVPVSLAAAATGFPSPTLQWYRGYSGDTSNPVPGATSRLFVTPGLAATTRFWVRATNASGAADSNTATIVIPSPPSSNGSLTYLALSTGSLSPSFNASTLAYSSSVPNAASTITVTPTTADAGATVTVNGNIVSSGSPSAPITLNPGANIITTVVTAADGVTTKSYAITVTPAAPLVLATNPATGTSPSAAVLNGTVTPHGSALVFFQYGTTPSYGSVTTGQDVSGAVPTAVQAALTGLTGNTIYHFRIVAASAGNMTYGSDMTFLTAPDLPVVATGTPFATSPSGATLAGAVNPRGLGVGVYFEYGLTTLYGTTTPVQNVPAGINLVDVQAAVTGLLADANYHYRIVATGPAGTSYGNDVGFLAKGGASGGGGNPTAVPGVATGDASAVTEHAATLHGSANPQGGTTLVHFEYGTSGYGFATSSTSVGNGTTSAGVSLQIAGLSPGTEYHYRVVASNSLGTATGEDNFFTTPFAKPDAATGEAIGLSTTGVRVTGSVRANQAAATVVIEYGTDPLSLSRSIDATPDNVTGDGFTPVQADLTNLQQGTVYFYRVVAENAGGTGEGTLRSFNVGVLAGLFQQFPPEIGTNDRQGSVAVTLTPAGIGGGWRFAGEKAWRLSGSAATGLTTSERVIEFRPVPGQMQPSYETVVVNSGGAPILLERAYSPAGVTGTGTLSVTLKPANLAAASVPAATRAQWRLFGETDAQWKDSGATLAGLAPGDYVIECKPVAGRTTPGEMAVVVADDLPGSATITYFIAEAIAGTPPGVLDFATVSSREDLPYAYVGQIRSDAGSSTGCVVRPRVVATAGHVVFDDGTLAAASGMQWLFQRDAGVHEPQPQSPRGFYLMTGYAARRADDDTPGESTPQSQNLDAAALYFLQDAGRGGFSGFSASDSLVNEFLTSISLKTLVGYPVDGIAAADQGRMHATPPANVGFSSAFGQTYTTTDIRSSGGNSGGPLFVRRDDGIWYPAAIFLGGTAQTVVRAIDSDVLDLFGFAEASASAGVGSAGGGFTQSDATAIETPELGAITVVIEPASARAAGAGWRIQALAPYAASGTRKSNLAPAAYTVQFATLSGFVPPAPQPVVIQAGLLRTLVFTYEAIIPPPLINSPEIVTGTRGQAVSYQITALNAPAFFSIRGALPEGMVLNENSGLISGLPQEAGTFAVTVGATNSGGSDTFDLTISVRPILPSQAVTLPYQQPADYGIAGSESGEGVTYTSGSLPVGLALNESTGRITGTPATPGVYVVPISVTKKAAVASASLTLTITGTPPLITAQPEALTVIEFGLGTTLSVTASGLPAPAFQWYEGASGDTANPVAGANTSSFSTPLLTSNASYWARANSISGSANSASAVIQLTPSTNADLSKIGLSAGDLTPAFSSGIVAYSAVVPYYVSSMTFTPEARISQSTVRVNGLPLTPGGTSDPVALAPGSNSIAVEVTAGDGSSNKIYTLAITRSDPPAVTTGVAAPIRDFSAVLNGTVTPLGNATVFFQYGPSTSYGKITPGQEVSGSNPVAIQAALAGLSANTLYHCRLAAATPAGTYFGQDMTFTTDVASPLAVTGAPASVTGSSAKLIGAVNPRGEATEAFFEYGATTLYGNSTPAQALPAGANVVDVVFTVDGLTAGNTYHYRIVALSPEGVEYPGADVSFQATAGGGGGDGIVDAAPTVTTGGSSDKKTDSAVLLGTVNPNDGITFVHFDYGLTGSYGFETAIVSVGNGGSPVNVGIKAEGLSPGTKYYYRLVASNSMGEIPGGEASLTTVFSPPDVTTGGAEALTSTSARLSATVRANGARSDVFFDYGTDGVNFPNHIKAVPASVTGDQETEVTVDLTDLNGAVIYYYRVRAKNSGGSSTGMAEPLQVGALQGLVSKFTREVPTGDHQGQVAVNLLPAGIGGWRFLGESQWRESGLIASGLTTGDRAIEYQPVSGYIQPPREPVGVVSGEPAVVLDRTYFKSAGEGSGVLRVQLFPDALNGSGLPPASRAQWRIAGDASAPWKDSGSKISGLMPGAYLVECKSVPGHDTPAPTTVIVKSGDLTKSKITYFVAGVPPIDPPIVLPFTTVSTARDLPFAYVGQIRSDSESYSGFVVKPRVVATAGQAVFNEATLAATTGMQWLLQQDRGTYEPVPQAPRGFYVFSGYDDQRKAEATPGTLAIESQNLNVAALYFSKDAGRGGFSGFLASDEADNEFLLSSSLKTLSGYPINGITPLDQGRMHTTPPFNSAFAWSFGRTYTNPLVGGGGGMIGGPLCVQTQGGTYYPAGIHVGGPTGGAVRAIDTGVIDLFSRAEISGNGGKNDTGGGITHSSFSTIGSSSDPGSIQVTILPAAALEANPGWRLAEVTDWQPSGNTLADLGPGEYTLNLTKVEGFKLPTAQVVKIEAGKVNRVEFTYVEDVNNAPTINMVVDQTIEKNNTTGTLGVMIDDLDDTESSLVLTGSSSNTNLVPNARIVFGGSGANRTVVVTPAANQTGTATITLTVSDGMLAAKETFELTVKAANAVNEAPSIGVLTDQVISEDTLASAIDVAISDFDQNANSLSLKGSSSNTGLVPNSGIVVGGSGANRTLTIAPSPDQSGTTTITLTVSDGALAASRNFKLTVNPVNDAPVVGKMGNQTINEDSNTGAIAFTVGDAESSAGSLTVSGSSSNTTLVPDSNIVFSGSGANRKVTVTPVANRSGSANVTVHVSDGNLVASETFTLIVNAVNDNPTIGNIENQTTSEDGITGALAFVVGDVETPSGFLSVNGSSSNPTLVPNSNIVFSGSGANRTVIVTPAANQSGSATITLTVSDGALTDTDTFVLTVDPMNDAPTLTDLTNQSIAVDNSTSVLSFTVGDAETSPGSLTLTRETSNPTLVPLSSIVFGGSGANRTVTVTPAAGQLGSTTVTVIVSDGTLTDTDTFTLTVTGNAQQTWRFANFGGASDTGDAANSADPDGDSQSNIDEFAAGTDPNNAADVFKILTATKAASSFTVTANGKAARSYVLHRQSTLGGLWEPVISVGPLGADAPVALTDPAPPATSAFYRLSVTGP